MSAFSEALYELPADQLRQLAEKRQIEPRRLTGARSKRELVGLLAQELARPVPINEALRHCTARELRLLQHLVAADKNPVSWGKIADLTALPDPRNQLADVLQGLTAQGLAFARPDGILLGSGVQSQVPVSPSDRYRVASLLNGYDAQTVKIIRNTLQLETGKDTKTDNIERISETLLAPGGVKIAPPLDEEEQSVLEFLVASGGSAMATEIVSIVLNARYQDFYGYDWQNRWKNGRPRNAVDRLLMRGLVYIVSWSYGFNLMMVIPGDLLRALAGGDESTFWTNPPPALEPLDKPIAQTKRQTQIVRDVVQFLGLLATADAARTNTGQIHRTALKNAARLMSLSDDRYQLFVYALCRAANFIAPAGEKQIYTLSRKGDTFLNLDTAEQWRVLYEAWHSDSLWAEMDNEPLDKPNSYRDAEMVRSVREAALDVIRGANAETFVTTQSVTDVMVSDSPLILAHNSIGINVVPSPAIFIRYLVAEPLYWLGVIEIAEPEGWTAPPPKITMKINRMVYSHEVTKPSIPDPPAFRLTTVGRWLLGQADAPAPEPEPREEQFILQPNAEVFVSPYLAPAVLYRLLTLTDIPKNGTGSMVSLTKEAIRRALDHGDTLAEMVAFFQRHSKTGVPQNVEYLINEVGGKHGHIHIGKAEYYIQTDTPLLMKELLARKEIRPYHVRELSDTIVLLQGENIDKLIKELRKAGYLPVADDDSTRKPVSSKPPTEAARARLIDIPAEKPAKRKVGVTLEDVSWDKFAQEDGLKLPAPKEPNKVNANVARNPELIKFIFTQSLRNSLRVELSYRDEMSGESATYLVEPMRVAADAVRAFDILSDASYTFNLDMVDWARLTDEKFVAR